MAESSSTGPREPDEAASTAPPSAGGPPASHVGAPDVEDAKSSYRALCRRTEGPPLFARDWWLDAVAGEDGWNVAVVRRNDEIVASWPYTHKRVLVFRVSKMPPLTQSLGVWMRYPESQKYATRLAFEKEIGTELVSKLPPFDAFRQSFHYSVTNWLPYYWQGFRATTRYTYVLEDLTDLDRVFGDFRENIRREIRKAERSVEVREDMGVEEFFTITARTFERQGTKPPFSRDLLERIDRSCAERDCRRIFAARDADGRVHAAVYLVWDRESAYYLIGGGDPELRTSGGTSLAMWKAIQFASGVTRRFDFEGSILEPVERFFRAFGAVQKPYFHLVRIRSRILRAAALLSGRI